MTFERWVTAQDAVDDLLRAQLGAERNWLHDVDQAAPKDDSRDGPRHCCRTLHHLRRACQV